MPRTSFVKAMKDFFGLLPGQSVSHFGSELKALSQEDKFDFAISLRAFGIDCADPEPPRVAA